MMSLGLFGVAVVLTPIYLVLLAVYRLTIHPLAKYPGPLSWRISGWPDGLAAKSGKRHIILHQLHCKYGHVVRVGPNRLSYNTFQAFHDVHANRNANVIKSGFVGFTRDIVEAHHLQQLPDKHEHAQRRKLMGHAFSDGALKSAEQFMVDQIDHWNTVVAKGADTSMGGWSETRNIGHWSNLLTLDIFGDLCFGENFHATDSGDHEMMHMILKGSKMWQILCYIPGNFLIRPILRTQALLKMLSKQMYETRWALRKHLDILIVRRQQAETDAEENKTEIRKDIFHHVLKARDDDGNMLPLPLYVSEAILLVAAGTDTTSTALSTALFYLNRNPDKLEKLRSEICKVFTDVSQIRTGPQLSSITYLRACIDEALRITPPVPSSLSRTTLTGGTVVENELIPADIEIEVPVYAVTHNQDHYPDPDTFLPERWIVGSKTPTFEVTEEVLSKQRSALVVFSLGPRNCLGMRMAYMEMSLVLARLLFLYDMRFDHEKQPQTKDFETVDCFISEKDGPYLQFKPRQTLKA